MIGLHNRKYYIATAKDVTGMLHSSRFVQIRDIPDGPLQE